MVVQAPRGDGIGTKDKKKFKIKTKWSHFQWDHLNHILERKWRVFFKQIDLLYCFSFSLQRKAIRPLVVT